MNFNKKRITRHILLWVAINLFIITATFTVSTNQNENFLLSLIFIAGIAINISLGIPFYLAYFLYKYLLSTKIRVRLITYILIAIFVLIYSKISISSIGNNSAISYFLNIVLYSMVLFFGFTFRNLFESFQQLKVKNELEKEKIKSEIAALKNTLNPHFFFNALNLIDTLIFVDAKKASEVLIELSDIIRYMIYETNSEKVSLKQEIDYLTKYINIVKTRFGYEESIQFDITGNYFEIQIAPLILINFIENAFKHSNIAKYDSRIEIKIIIHKSRVIFSVINDYNPLTNNNKINNVPGIGLATVRKRLELMYPDKHYLKINTQNNKYFVELWIDTDEK